MITLNARQLAMNSLFESVLKSTIASLSVKSIDRAARTANETINNQLAEKSITLEEYQKLYRVATKEELQRAYETSFVTLEDVRDYQVVGFHVPQRSGSSVMAAFIALTVAHEFPDANILFIGPHNIDDVGLKLPDGRVTNLIVRTPSEYGRVLRALSDNVRHKPDSEAPNLIIVDQASWIGCDARFQKLLEAVHKPHARPFQMLLHFSS